MDASTWAAQTIGLDILNEIMVTQKTIIVIGTEPWLSPLLSKHHVVLELCKRHRVIYIDPVFHMGNLLRLHMPDTGYKLSYHQQKPANLVVLKPWWLPKTQASRILNKVSESYFVAQLRRRIETPNVIISFNPNYAFLTKYFCCPFIYYCVDTHQDRSKEPDSIACAATVIAATKKLYDEFALHAQCVRHLPHGVDLLSLRDSAKFIPEDIKGIPRPIAGFIGAVNDHLDIPLLEYLANMMGELSIVLVGPYEKSDFGGGLSAEKLTRLQQFSNIYLSGPKPSGQLGAYINQFDVGLIPYDLNHFRIHFSYHKVLQYLALGKPVVTTVNSADGKLPPSTWLGETPITFARAVVKSLVEHSPTDMSIAQKFADEHSWERRVEQLEEWIDRIN
ncbi:MAG: hypothetical protein R3E79_31935 [Caldilineaceae bacterium]